MEDEKASQRKENGKEVTKKGVVIGAAVLALVLALVVIAVIAVMGGKDTDGDNGSTSMDGVTNVGHGRIADDDEEEAFIQEASEVQESASVSPESYVVQMSDSTWRFTDSSSPSYDAVIYNAQENICDMYFTVMVKETQETVFVSDTMSPGQKMTDVELDFDGEAGEYPCSMVYHLLEPESGTEYGTLTLAITVVIEN